MMCYVLMFYRLYIYTYNIYSEYKIILYIYIFSFIINFNYIEYNLFINYCIKINHKLYFNGFYDIFCNYFRVKY